MTVLAIDGYEYSSLRIVKFKYSVEILDGPGTGRVSSDGWPMHREPQGIIKNVEAEIWLTESSNDDFQRLLNTLNSFGVKAFAPVSFITPSGVISQDMYAASYSIELKKITKAGVTYWGTLPIKFVAKQGRKG